VTCTVDTNVSEDHVASIFSTVKWRGYVELYSHVARNMVTKFHGIYIDIHLQDQTVSQLKAANVTMALRKPQASTSSKTKNPAVFLLPT
jgi:hypothetical protein